MIKQVHCIFLIIALFAATTFAQEFKWENYTNKDEIVSLESFAGFIWAATTGGVVRINPATNEIKSYINSDGLGSIKINFAAIADGSEIYFGSADGFLSKMNLESESFNSIQLHGRDGGSLELNAADTSGDFLWIASGVGLIKYDRLRNGGEVKETYRNLGNFASESPVNDVIVLDGRIIAGTDEGLAIADLDNQFLLDPGEWTTIALGTVGVPDIRVTCFGIQDGVLYFGTDQRLYSLGSEDQIIPVEGLAAAAVLDLKQGGEQPPRLYALVVTEGGRQIFQVAPLEWLQLQYPSELSTSLNSIAFAQNWYLGSDGKGLYKVVSPTNLVKLGVPGPASNNLIGGGYGAEGQLLVVARDNDLSILTGGVWQQQTVSPSEKLSALVSKSGDTWIATFGSGAFRVSGDGAVQQFTNGNSPLVGVEQDASFSVVNSVDEDPDGRIWFSLFRANPIRPIVMFDPPDSLWTWFDAADGLVSDNNQVIAAGSGTAAIGIDDQGVAFLRYGNNPSNHNDDQLDFFGRSRRLPSDIVTALAYDRDNVLWVGTNQGLAYFDAGIDFFFPTALPEGIGSEITAIATDTRNNLWVGTSSGLGFLPAATGEPIAFTSSNSDLVSNEIEGLVYDDLKKKLLVFTRGGLSILDYTTAGPDNGESVYAYPNPFRIGSTSDDLLQFHIDLRADVKILNVAGDLVRETTVNEGWDGRNDSGEFVASGVYIWTLKAEDNSHHSGKVFVIRR